MMLSERGRQNLQKWQTNRIVLDWLVVLGLTAL